MVGTTTALLDNPRLNVREVEGSSPTRVVIDLNGRLPDTLHLFDGSQATVVTSTAERPATENLEFVAIDPAQPVVQQVLSALYKRKLQSLMVEGGTATLQAFIDAGLWDEARVFTGFAGLGHGVKGPKLKATSTATMKVGTDRLDYFRKA